MRKLLIDTSVIIDFLRLLRLKKNHESLLGQLAQEELYVSMLTYAELFSGKSIWEKQKERAVVDVVFSGIHLLPLTQKLSEEAGRIKAFHPNVSLVDCIIAASALQEDLEVVTLNIKDFKNIEKLRLYNP